MANLFTDSFFRKQISKIKAELGIDDAKLAEYKKIIKNRIDYVNNFDQGEGGEEIDWPGFEKHVFRDLLGYSIKDDSPSDYNILRQKKIKKAGKGGGTGKADCTLGFYPGKKKQEGNDLVIVEFKAPDSKDLKEAENQLWGYLEHHESSKWGIVTNFNEFTLYNVSARRLKKQTFYFVVPDDIKDKKPSLAEDEELVKFLSIFRKDRMLVQKGRSAAETMLEQQGIEEKKIEKEFYKKYYNLRINLFNVIAEHNPQYSQKREELVSITQKILDRLIFIWFCEDSREELLPRDILQNLIGDIMKRNFRSGFDIWDEIKKLFNFIDTGNGYNIAHGYNGELFKPDSRIDELIIPNEIFEIQVKPIGEEYDFGHENELSVNILGHIFEQSITDLEELKQGEPADRKKGKRKREGVYYTPEYITRYIVEQALGGWLAERRKELGEDDLPELTEQVKKKGKKKGASAKKPKLTKEVLEEVRQATGNETLVNAMSFWRPNFKDNDELRKALETLPDAQPWIEAIIGIASPCDESAEAWQVLEKFWRNYREVLKSVKVLDPACGSGAFLIQAFDFLHAEGTRVNSKMEELGLGAENLFDLDKSILENNLYGVDINDESVEITKLSLWLKTASKDKKLNSLFNNIKCGNSLIDDPKVAGKKAFKWEEQFPEIMKNGGFDVVVGNPPYVQSHSISENCKNFYYENYETAEYQINTYGLFMEKVLKLLNTIGKYGLIVPNYWLSTHYDEKLRRFIFISNSAYEIINTFNVFDNVTVDTLIISGSCKKSKVINDTHIRSIDSKLNSISERLLSIQDKKWSFEKSIAFDEQNDTKLNFDTEFSLNGEKTLSDYFEFKQGMKPYEKGKGIPPQTREMMKNKVYDATYQIDETYEPLLKARNIKPYTLLWTNDWIKYGSNLAAPRTRTIFEGKRILISRIISKEKIDGTFLTETYINNTDLINILPKKEDINIKAFLTIILSKLCTSYLKKQNVNLNRKAFPKINVETLKAFPVPSLYDNSISYLEQKADTMLDLNKQLADQKQSLSEYLTTGLGVPKLTQKLQSPENISFDELIKELKKKKISTDNRTVFESIKQYHEKISSLKTQIDRTDREIDRMVYELYGLTEDEIRIVEGA